VSALLLVAKAKQNRVATNAAQSAGLVKLVMQFLANVHGLGLFMRCS
jgi:hypothetical protein